MGSKIGNYPILQKSENVPCRHVKVVVPATDCDLLELVEGCGGASCEDTPHVGRDPLNLGDANDVDVLG